MRPVFFLRKVRTGVDPGVYPGYVEGMEKGNNMTATKTNTHYIIQSASAKMPNSCWGQYGRVAVLEVEDGVDHVAMISGRARGVVRVVETWEKLNVGKFQSTGDNVWKGKGKCAFSCALKEAADLLESLAVPS